MAPLSFLLLEEGVAGPAELESLGRDSVFILHRGQMRPWPLWWTGNAQYATTWRWAGSVSECPASQEQSGKETGESDAAPELVT